MTTLCNKNFDALRYSVRQVWNSPQAAQNAALDILYILENCVPLNRTTLCNKNLDALRYSVRQVWNSPQAAQNAALKILYILENCVPLNRTTLCNKNLDALRYSVRQVWNSPQAAQNATLKILYILENCVRYKTIANTMSIARSSNFSNADGVVSSPFVWTPAKKVVAAALAIGTIFGILKLAKVI